LFRPVPVPTRDAANALCLVDTYLTRAGTRLASRFLGCPEPDRDAALVAELGDALLRGAALCAGLRGLADVDDAHHRL
jgi:hypothetical protein